MIQPEEIELAQGAHNNGNGTDVEHTDNEDVEEITDPEIDLSLLHDEDGVGDSDKSNDDAEAIKLLNDDDEAFESFLEDEDASNDLLLSNSNKDIEPIELDDQELNQGSSNSRPNESENTNTYEPNEKQDKEGILEENEVYFENEEEEIDDEMEGDEDKDI